MEIVEPTNPIDILIRLLVGLLLAGLGVNASMQPPGGGGGGGAPVPPPQGSRSDTVIESAQVLVLESLPPQLNLVVSGYQPDGCELPVLVEQRREGSTITVDIYRLVPPDLMCTMALVPYEATIPLEGPFESGAYQVIVNGVVVDVTL